MKATANGKKLVYKHIHMDIIFSVEDMSIESLNSKHIKIFNECTGEDELISITFDSDLSTKKLNVYQIKKYEFHNKNLFEYQLYVDTDSHLVDIWNRPLKLTFNKQYLFYSFHEQFKNNERIFLKESKFPMELSKHNMDCKSIKNFVDYYQPYSY